MTVVDVGAHVGLYALTASRIVGQEGMVYAFEPEPHNFNLLIRNIEANKLSNVVALRKAVADRSGELPLYVHPRESTLHSVKVGWGGRSQIVVCDVVTLDEIFAGQRVDFVKVDVEGAELAVLNGMSRTIQGNQNIKLLLEFAPALLRTAGVEPMYLLQWLQQHGLVVHRVNEGKREMTAVLLEPHEAHRMEQGVYLFCTHPQGIAQGISLPADPE